MESIADGTIFARAGVASHCVGARGIHVTFVTSGCTFIHICGNKHLFNGLLTLFILETQLSVWDELGANNFQFVWLCVSKFVSYKDGHKTKTNFPLEFD